MIRASAPIASGRAGLLALGCAIGAWSCTSSRASAYGVSDTTLAAVVVQNTSDFRLTTIEVAPRAGTQAAFRVTSGDGRLGVVPVPPGSYTVTIGYQGGEERDYVARGAIVDTVVVAAGRAFVFKVRGGDPFYSPREGRPAFLPPGIVRQTQFEVTALAFAAIFVVAIVGGAVGHRLKTGSW
jgi:hypothetical protein